MNSLGGAVIRIPVMALLALLVLPVRILVTLLLRQKRRKRTVLVWTLGEGRKPLEPAPFERLLLGLKDAAGDPKLKGLRIEVRSAAMGWANLYRLRTAVEAVRTAGKRVEVHLDALGDREMLLASAADRISVSPASELYLQGVATPVRFFGAALARHEVVVDLESAGAYKSFGEAYTRSQPTVENREAMGHLLGGLHARLCQTIADARSLTPSDIVDAMASAPLSADQAKERGLIDAVAYTDEDWAEWDTFMGGEAREVPLLAYARWKRVLRRLPAVRSKAAPIAVVHLDGPVVERGSQMPRKRRVIASDDVVPALDALADQDQIKAVVLAVNSPGGSALASDLIARSVTALAKRKPVVAVMGNVAASGGYYISAVAHEIVAHPATITGSIGVVGGKVVLGRALARLGVHTTWMGPAPDPGMMTPEAPFDDEQRRRFRASLSRVYDRFIAVVAGGRGMNADAVEPLAQGRVWTGEQALGNGLVDRLGSLQDGIERAAELAELGNKRVVPVPIRFEPPKFAMVSQMMGGQTRSAESHLAGLLGAESVLFEALIGEPSRPLMLAPMVLDQGAWAGWAGSP